MKYFPKSELVLNSSNEVYHLGLKPENISNKIILVGDQERVGLVSSFFDEITHRSQHREFICNTGIYKSKRISVLSTGIGTDNIDITINEIDALLNIDLDTRTEKAQKQYAEFIRIGTCGILQEDIPLHSYILSSHALGLDNIAFFYDLNLSCNSSLLEEITTSIEFPDFINPYLVESSLDLTEKLNSERVHKGITITSSGFYGPQGRQLRLKTKTEELNEQLTAFKSDKLRITNFEMESSALFALSHALGHKATTICLGIANRPLMHFSEGYRQEMLEMIEYTLDRI